MCESLFFDYITVFRNISSIFRFSPLFPISYSPFPQQSIISGDPKPFIRVPILRQAVQAIGIGFKKAASEGMPRKRLGDYFCRWTSI